MNNKSVYTTLGASNHTHSVREPNDLYCTHPDAVKALLNIETLHHDVWEPCDGLGHISNTLLTAGYNVRRSDLFTRNRDIEQLDFLSCKRSWCGDIVTNPPYSNAEAMVRKALSVVEPGCKVILWLRILFLESKSRKELFSQYPPLRVWISSRRIPCGKNGQFGASAQGYAWFVWEKGYNGCTTINWF